MVGLRKIFLFLIIVVVGAGVVWVQAAPPGQTGQEIQFGETVSGTITEETTCQYYWFDGLANQRITVDMRRTSGDLDGVLSLYLHDDFTSEAMISNDDRGDGTLDPQLSMRLPATDWYSIAACGLEGRGTTGTFDLTLIGPAGTTTPTPADVTATAPSMGGLTTGLFPTGTETPVPVSAVEPLADGSIVNGTLSSGGIDYPLPVQAGDWVELTWTGEAAPQITVSDSSGLRLAQASGMDLVLSFVVWYEDTLTVHVDCADCSQVPYVLSVSITNDGPGAAAAAPDEASGGGGLQLPTPVVVATQPSPIVTPTPDVTATPSPTPAPDYREHPCESGTSAVLGPASSAHISNAYTASGDGYLPEEVTATNVFLGEDDLNVVITIQGASSQTASVVFCAPSGQIYDALEDDVQRDQAYLFGLDWESGNGTSWESGTWFAEVYVNDVLELSLQFEVE